MRNKMVKRSARMVCSLLAAGILWGATGCDQLNGLLGVAKATAVAAVQDQATAAIEGAVSGILGGVIPGAGGS